MELLFILLSLSVCLHIAQIVLSARILKGLREAEKRQLQIVAKTSELRGVLNVDDYRQKRTS